MVKLGSAFSDALMVEERSRSRHDVGDIPWWAGSGRALLFATVLFVGFFILSWRLFDLTLLHGREYRKLSDTNRTRELVRHAPRGLLLDRTGKPLVANEPQYRLLKPCTAGSTNECVTYLSHDEGEKLSSGGLPAGQYLEVDYVRNYLYDETLAHVVGYTGELSPEELGSDYYKLRNYSLGDRVGRMGAEAVFNERLRGGDGKELAEVDAGGKIIRTLGRQEEIPGENTTLSLDLGIAKAAKAAFPSGFKGAIVVTKPTTGEILALYSSPGFSPNAFTLGMTSKEYEALTANPDLPMFNRAIGGVYPPGSTFKIVTALAGLEEHAITTSTTVEDNGVITIGPFTFPNWYFVQYGKTEGMVDIVKALQRSNDIFFYNVGEWLGVTKLGKWAHTVGLGKPLGIELSGEAGGLVPDPAWKNARFNTASDIEARNNEWYLGDTYHMAIGQGYLLVTPLQVNSWTNIIASGGKLCKPTIGRLASLKSQRDNCKDMGISKEIIDVITDGMRRACAPGGTGWPLFDFTISKQNNALEGAEASLSAKTTTRQQVPVACKTGTAEFGDPNNHTHAWFTVFAPLPESYIPEEVKHAGSYVSGDPEISVTVLVEAGGEGSNVAAPIAKKILEEWFSR